MITNLFDLLGTLNTAIGKLKTYYMRSIVQLYYSIQEWMSVHTCTCAAL